MEDYIVRATAADSSIRAFAMTSREIVEEARQRHNTSPVVTAALGRLLTGGAMMGVMMKGDKDLLTVQIQSGGPMKGMTVTADSKGHVKGYPVVNDVMLPPNKQHKLDVGGAVGVGMMRVIKDMGLKEPYVGTTVLQTSEIAEDLTYYFATSEQVPSSVGLGVLMNKDNTVRQADLVFSIDPYTYQLTVSGNADRDTLSQIEKLLNEGDNAKNIWTHAWICMHDSDNEIVNSQANRTKANQYSLWHEVYETTGYDARNATYRNGTFIAEDGTDLLALFKEKAKNGTGYELYSNRWLEYAKNGWKKENDLVLKIGFDSSGLYDIGQERGYGATQNMWMKGISQSIFEASV